MWSALGFPKRSAGSIVRENREQREFHAEAASLAFLARDLYLAVMGCTDRFDNRESQPGSSGGAGAGLVGAVEALEHMGQRMSGDAKAIVGHFEYGDVPLPA